MRGKILKTLALVCLILGLGHCTRKTPEPPKVMESQSLNGEDEKPKNLTEQLAEKAALSAEKSPAETRQVMMKAIEDLKNSQVMNSALKKGEKAPEFELPDVQKGMVRSTDLLKNGPILLTFYRGGWCPYCNLQLRDLQSHLEEIKATGATLVAISPQKPDATAETVKKENLEYYVLSDANGEVGKKFGLMFKLPPDLIEVYKGFGIDLEQSNGNKNWELPLAATYIINPDGMIRYAFVDADYKKRAETTELIKLLQESGS